MSGSCPAPRTSGQRALAVATVVWGLMAFALFSAPALSEPISENPQQEDEEKDLDLDFSLKEPVSINDYGVGGILDIPSARMFEEGVGTFTYSRRDVMDNYALGYQFTPRIETVFRYSIPDARRTSGRDGPPNELADRNFEIRYRLLEETRRLPSLVVGIRDLGGSTRDGGAEYLVASKNFGPLDLTLGVGWGAFSGRSALRNPFGHISKSFESRGSFGTGNTGGQFGFDAFFRGKDVGLFGGLRYEIAKSNLALLAAYNSDPYLTWVQLGSISDSSPLSLGIEWSPSQDFQLALSRQQGASWALRVSASVDTGKPPRLKPPNGFGAEGIPIVKPVEWPEERGWYPRFSYDAEKSGIVIFGAQIEDFETLIVRFRNDGYRLEADAIRRVLTLAELYAPPRVSEIVVVGEVSGLPVYSVRYKRLPLDAYPSVAPYDLVSVGPPVEITRQDFVTRFQKKYRVDFGLGPKLYLFDPYKPLLYQFSLRASFGLSLGKDWGLRGSWTQSLTTKLDEIDRESDSQLPRVRSDSANYLREGASGLDSLVVWSRGKLGSDVYFQAYGGLLEEMYAGLSAEMLWRPFDSRWALGVSAQAVRQRDFDKLFKLRDLRATPGHVSLYWATPFNNIDLAVHAGRYLAGDVGATFEVKKQLANGWIIGAFATLTNVPREVFGEGSFDKGITLSVPVDFFSTSNSRERSSTSIRLVNRDGGRPVEGPVRSLWDLLRDTEIGRLDAYRERMVPQ